MTAQRQKATEMQLNLRMRLTCLQDKREDGSASIDFISFTAIHVFFVGCSHSCLFQTAVVAYSEIMGVSEKLWFIIILESQAESS